MSSKVAVTADEPAWKHSLCPKMSVGRELDLEKAGAYGEAQMPWIANASQTLGNNR